MLALTDEHAGIEIPERFLVFPVKVPSSLARLDA